MTIFLINVKQENLVFYVITYFHFRCKSCFLLPPLKLSSLEKLCDRSLDIFKSFWTCIFLNDKYWLHALSPIHTNEFVYFLFRTMAISNYNLARKLIFSSNKSIGRSKFKNKNIHYIWEEICWHLYRYLFTNISL